MTTMEAALQIHEIVGMILSHLDASCPTDRSTLRSCSLVNHTFFCEANRLRWAECSVFSVSNRLFHLAERDPLRAQVYAAFIRAQVYAAFIRSMEISIIPLFYRWSRFNGNYSIDGLQFPSLNKLSLITGPTSISTVRYWLMQLVTLLNPLLSWLEIPWLNSETMTSFWSRFSLLSPGLQNLRLSSTHFKTGYIQRFQDVSLARCIKDLPSLVAVELKGDVGWSEVVFHALAEHPSLQYLLVPSVMEKTWVSSLKSKPFVNFARLRELITLVSTAAFTELVQHIETISSLELRQERSTQVQPSLLVSASQLYLLESLVVVFPKESQITVTGLARLASGCPNLMVLSLDSSFGWEDELPGGFGADITDESIIELAKSLPMLGVFSLRLSDSSLTTSSLLALGEYCPYLRRCTICAFIDLEKTMEIMSSEKQIKTSRSESFGWLKCLTILFPEDDVFKYRELSWLDWKSLQSKFQAAFPDLHEFTIEGVGLEEEEPETDSEGQNQETENND